MASITKVLPAVSFERRERFVKHLENLSRGEENDLTLSKWTEPAWTGECRRFKVPYRSPQVAQKLTVLVALIDFSYNAASQAPEYPAGIYVCITHDGEHGFGGVFLVCQTLGIGIDESAGSDPPFVDCLEDLLSVEGVGNDSNQTSDQLEVVNRVQSGTSSRIVLPSFGKSRQDLLV